ncbi:hypothetical protein GOP47_0021936 [Adiantum capillus-veneris]|uniref:Uncharacterized protein n=1 Tax=Adiantum capillus-veneris TaxID=13818 RepID=A0A9D4UA48_ADICA|nr:hypothetical protein GOP47_0021936 [Adiantum capillus-veneris]
MDTQDDNPMYSEAEYETLVSRFSQHLNMNHMSQPLGIEISLEIGNRHVLAFNARPPPLAPCQRPSQFSSQFSAFQTPSVLSKLVLVDEVKQLLGGRSLWRASAKHEDTFGRLLLIDPQRREKHEDFYQDARGVSSLRGICLRMTLL